MRANFVTWMRALLAAIGLVGLTLAPAQAHVTNVSRSNVAVEGQALRYRLDLVPLDLAIASGVISDPAQPITVELLRENEPRLTGYVLSRVLAFGDGQACAAGAAAVSYEGFPHGIHFSWTFACPPAFESLLIQYLVFEEIDRHHATVGRLVGPGGATDFTLGGDHPELEIGVAAIGESPWSQAWRFFGLGIEHILTGYDHVLFLLGLIVASLRWRYLLTVITMFTLAHTVTLLLAAFGWVRLPSALVESVIALSIAYVAAENLLKRGLRWRWVVTFLFGLVHGLGFASVLAELTQGAAVHIGSLFTFNLGVEAGQMMIVSAVLPVLLIVERFRLHPPVEKFASAAILLMALYWFGQRAIWG